MEFALIDKKVQPRSFIPKSKLIPKNIILLFLYRIEQKCVITNKNKPNKFSQKHIPQLWTRLQSNEKYFYAITIFGFILFYVNNDKPIEIKTYLVKFYTPLKDIITKQKKLISREKLPKNVLRRKCQKRR